MKLLSKSQSEDFKGFLDEGTSLTGEIAFTGTLRVDGAVHGSITTDDVLIVGEKASINADIKAGEIQIYGRVFGNVECSRRINIYSGGTLKGDVRTPGLVIEEGARFEGHSLGAKDAMTRESRDAVARDSRDAMTRNSSDAVAKNSSKDASKGTGTVVKPAFSTPDTSSPDRRAS